MMRGKKVDLCDDPALGVGERERSLFHLESCRLSPPIVWAIAHCDALIRNQRSKANIVMMKPV